MNARTLDTRRWARWLAGFVGFPIAGLTAKAIAGPIDSAGRALVGGLAAGAALGFVQAIALGERGPSARRWVVATAAGMAVGLTAGSAAVGYRTDTTSLVVMGMLSGLGIGAAQAVVFPSGTSTVRRMLWMFGLAGLWPLGWYITAQVIVDADAQFSNFGASGALVVTALSGFLHPAITRSRLSGRERAGGAAPRSTVCVAQSVEIDRSVGAVWEAIADYSFDLRWRAGLVEMSPVPAGPPANGTRVREVLRSSGLTFTTDAVVSDVEPGVGYRFRGEGTTGIVRGLRRVEPGSSADRAVFTYEVELAPTGIFRLLGPVLRGALDAGLRKDLQELKRLMESSGAREAGAAAASRPTRT